MSMNSFKLSNGRVHTPRLPSFGEYIDFITDKTQPITTFRIFGLLIGESGEYVRNLSLEDGGILHQATKVEMQTLATLMNLFKEVYDTGSKDATVFKH